MKYKINQLLLIILMVVISDLKAQQSFDLPGVKVYNFTNFLPAPVQKISSDLLEHTSDNFEQHPEYGILPYNAQCEDCFEIIEKRTSNTRYFIKENSQGTKFYSQASMNDLHYKNEKGEIITIDPRLKPVSGKTGIYRADSKQDKGGNCGFHG